MRQVAVPDDLFARLQALAVPLVDTTADVVGKLLDHYDRTKPEKAGPRIGGNTLLSSQVGQLLRGSAVAGRVPRERGATIEIEGQQFRAVSVRDMYEQALKLIVDNGHSKRLKQLVPFRTSSLRYLIAERPTHPNGNAFVVPARHGGYFMEAHKDYRNAVKHLGQLLAKPGLKLRYLG